MIKRLTSGIAATALLAVAGMLPVHSAEVTMRVLGWYGNQPQSTEIERPFWKDLEAQTGGLLAAQFRTIDEIGLKGFESLRTLQSGAFDIVSFQISFVGGDAPVLMGADLPGLAFDFDELRKVVDVYRPILEIGRASCRERV
jgi:TRAP-type C4-dicarboxylate transport system, periplasmic component